MNHFEMFSHLFVACIDFIMTPLSITVPILCLLYILFNKRKYSKFSILLIAMLATSNVFAHTTGMIISKDIQELSIILTAFLVAMNSH